MKYFKVISSIAALVVVSVIFLIDNDVLAAEQWSKVNVLSCEQLDNGIKIKKVGVSNNQPYILSNGVKDAGHGYRKYTFTCLSKTQYKVVWQEYGLATPGTLTIEIDPETPIGYNMLLGTMDQTLAKFKITASNQEDIVINKLVISANLKSFITPYVISNLRLYDVAGAPIGKMVNLSSDVKNGTYVSAIFNDLNLEVAKNTSKSFSVKADIISFVEAGNIAASNTAAQLAILPDYSDQPGVQPSIVAYGKQSGGALVPTSFTFKANDGWLPLTTASNGTKSQLSPNNGYVRGSEFVFYRAKLGVAWATDTPSGASSPSTDQNIAKFVITNLANSGIYVAKIKYFNFGISSTIKNKDNSTYFLRIYKDSLATTPLATVSFNGQFSNTALTDGGMTDIEIAAGSSKTFFVTLDTSAAIAGQSLSIRIPVGPPLVNGGTAYGMEWSDGVTNDIIAAGWDLPLMWKTMTY